MIKPQDLYNSPNALAAHYGKFRVQERVLLTGHSHQAWPDCGFVGQQRAWTDAAEYVDHKWERAFAEADRVRSGFARLMDDNDGDIALAENTHHLVVRFVSALPLTTRPKIVTTDGEFHTVRRQLDRLSEEGIEVVRVTAEPVETLAERIIKMVDDRTSAVMVSSVLFGSARIVPGIQDIWPACARVGSELLVDTYHMLNVVPFSIHESGLARAYIVGGGYKYCQLGEGNCFLRLPKECKLRPVITGWYSEFSALTTGDRTEKVMYGQRGDRFAGATYDPTSHYRAADVFEFFRKFKMTPQLLREISQHQVGLLARLFDDMDLDPEVIRRDASIPLESIGGFLALRSPKAGDISGAMRKRDVYTDHRGEVLRLGPAPYLSDEQLKHGMETLGAVVKELR